MIAVTGGGTGGHVFPNVAVVEELRRRGESRLIWIGDRRGPEREAARRLEVPFYGIRTGKLRRYLSLRNFRDLFSVAAGFFGSLRVLASTRPRVLFSKGGFVSVPPALAAWVLRIPVVTHESDILPGLATRMISRVAATVCVSFPGTVAFFPAGRAVLTGNPVRGLIREGDAGRGRRFLGVDTRGVSPRGADPIGSGWHRVGPRAPLVLVLGGSQGAASLNRAVRALAGIGGLSFVLVHQCGRGNLRAGPGGGEAVPREAAATREAAVPRVGGRGGYLPYEFFGEEMGDVLAAADLVVSRAGAGALSEIACAGKPSVLVPLPRSGSRGEQITNARFFADSGAAVLLPDEQLSARALEQVIRELLSDRAALEEMGWRARSLYVDRAEAAIVDLLLEKRRPG
ncbi:MAG: undecaprenyldiphospho-muramoylpentapeptide beta-N-acetylglucosaminyltransferase [Spirochaetota bacterium]